MIAHVHFNNLPGLGANSQLVPVRDSATGNKVGTPVPPRHYGPPDGRHFLLRDSS